MDKLNFSSFAGGGVEEKLQYALSEVADNIADPNTDAKKARSITMKITIKPNESRMVCDADIEVKTSLVAPKGISTTLLIDRDNNGKAVASEMYGKDPAQGVINYETGEVIDIRERGVTRNDK
jgi:hypothetical protein